jgi:hypothetical protein
VPPTDGPPGRGRENDPGLFRRAAPRGGRRGLRRDAQLPPAYTCAPCRPEFSSRVTTAWTGPTPWPPDRWRGSSCACGASRRASAGLHGLDAGIGVYRGFISETDMSAFVAFDHVEPPPIARHQAVRTCSTSRRLLPHGQVRVAHQQMRSSVPHHPQPLHLQPRPTAPPRWSWPCRCSGSWPPRWWWASPCPGGPAGSGPEVVFGWHPGVVRARRQGAGARQKDKPS